MMEQDPCLQRCQRIDILHIGRTAHNRGNKGINVDLGQGSQRQHIGRDSRTTFGDTVGGHDKGADVTLDSLSHIDEDRRDKHAANIELPAQMTQRFDQTDNHQGMAAEFKEVVMAADLFQSQ
ncbi:hypothetical protein Xkoz_03646 [Xenorhabdus kozodoii]|uniref:Uncharacterized protein n=1 Tax=Xenorhabdus kozodoii TaxID=351676 RepID=A0A2D0KYZ1_9GAMM|nr:hypothetical protein Xkoz_03646 [Xenorhabdus kozodoii]